MDSKTYKKIFSFIGRSDRIISRENSWLEFKESFNWGSKDEYAKSMAAFANNKGGFIIFGVTNKPKKLVGLKSTNFDDLDEAKISEYLNSAFSPEINFEKFSKKVRGNIVGILYTYPSNNKPVVCIKNDGEIKEAEIYYRYSARSEKIKYAELNLLLKSIQENEQKNWMSLFEKIAKIGSTNTAILNVADGRIDGNKGSLLIDRKLIPKLRFIKEGNFREKGWPTLRLIGDVKPISVKGGPVAVRFTDDSNAPVVRMEEEKIIQKEYPLDFNTLKAKLKNRYTDFTANPRFYSLKREFMKDPRLCKVRYLDPINLKGGQKVYYSLKILKEFDKYYK